MDTRKTGSALRVDTIYFPFAAASWAPPRAQERSRPLPQFPLIKHIVDPAEDRILAPHDVLGHLVTEPQAVASVGEDHHTFRSRHEPMT